MKKIFLLALLPALFWSCSHKAERVERAFYFWKSNDYQLSDQENNLMDTLQVKKIYVKFFEVEKNDLMGYVPISKTDLHLYSNDNITSLIPTVYITNEVFKKAKPSDMDALADNVNFLIGKYTNDKFHNVANVDEYQMDCDWTLSTRDSYFYFLKKLKQVSGKKISCTLRLYPYKYPDKMGVPPVDKAMLMCYNLLNPLQEREKNSILDINELHAYLNSGKKYPLHLDVALPVYSWMQVYQNDHFAQVVYTNTKDIKTILTPNKPLWYTVKKDTVINDFYIRSGDKVKIEEQTAEQLNKAVAIIKKYVPLDKDITVSLFHLDQEQLSRYSHEEIAAFYTGFTQ